MWNSDQPFPGPYIGPGPLNAMSAERLHRQFRIAPCIDVVRRGAIPDLSKEHLLGLITDLKTEGNDLFKDKDYINAGEHYTCALCLAKILQTCHFVEVDKEVMSTLFTNRAACFNKLDIFSTAAEDCDFAIIFNKQNIKAYYRKAVALKGMKRYQEAVDIAIKGRNITGCKANLVNDFDELIKEIQSHLPSSSVESLSQASAVRRTSTQRSRGAKAVHSTSSLPSTEASSKIKAKGVDMTWLEGTNVTQTTQVKRAPDKVKTVKQKSSKKVSLTNKVDYKGRFAALLAENEMGDEEESSEDAEDTDPESLVSDVGQAMSNAKATGATETVSMTEMSWADKSEDLNVNDSSPFVPVTGPSFKQESVPQSTNNYSSYMRTDDIGLSSHSSPVQHQQSAVTTITGSFQSIHANRALPYPFSSDYEFTFACSTCFYEAPTGPLVRMLRPNLKHYCSKELFIVRRKGASEDSWVNIRSRPKVEFSGEYHLCSQYVSGMPCRVSRPLCHFCHSHIEQHLWTLDRSKQFNLGAFVNEWRAYALACANQSSPAQIVKPAISQQPQHMQMMQSQTEIHQLGENTEQRSDVQQSEFCKPVMVEVSGTKKMMQRYIFPLKDSHRFRIVCRMCLAPTGSENSYEIKSVKHICKENMLVVQPKNATTWTQVRERINHRNFAGGYIRCKFFGSLMPCRAADKCLYAHSTEEQILWTLEKDNKFNITEFILQNRSPKTKWCFSLNDLFTKHPGWFQFLCHSCFYAHPCRISVQDAKNSILCSSQLHHWANNMLLIHVNLQNVITPIAEWPFKHKGAYYLLCHKMRYCLRQAQTKCTFAHSMVERDVWLIERDHEVSREEIAKKSQLFLIALAEGQVLPDKDKGESVQLGPDRSESTKALDVPAVGKTEEGALCPFRVLEVCNLCWKMGLKIQKDKTRQDRCAGSGMGHMWTQNRAYVIVPENKLLRPLPKRIPTGCRWVICKHVREKGKCTYSLGGYCQFAHSEIDKAVWTWMVTNNVLTLEELYHRSTEAQKANSTVKKLIPKGQTVVWAKVVGDEQQKNKVSPFQLSINCLYCHYCSVQCNGQKQWDSHCASEKHLFNVNSDKEHQWNYRQPPWGVPAGNYQLCTLHLQKKCRYSDKPDMYNFCKFAHSQEELDEWKERWEWRQMKRAIARKEQMYSFMEELLDDYQMAQNSISVISDQVPGVHVDCDSELYIYKEAKSSTHVWTFKVVSTTNKHLVRVALLHNHDRLHFSLLTDELVGKSQIAQGDIFIASENSSEYSVRVQFVGGIFGSFMQWVVFDFGERPVLVRKLGIELGTQFIQDKVKRLRQLMKFDRWTDENRQIIKYAEPRSDSVEAFEDYLLKQYKPPASVNDVITQCSIGVGLNRHNYVHKMHKLLEIEEIKRAQIIASYCHDAEIELQDKIEEEGVMIASRSELFAKVPLNQQLSQDTDAGKLILTSVKSVLIAPAKAPNNKVYEAVMVTKENFDYDGRGRDYIYICLSPRCVHDLELVAGDYVKVQMQFQMDRVFFCRMHFAVDQLETNDIVFPDISRINPKWNEERVYDISSQVLNTDQLNIVQHILAQRSTYSPPVVVYGPFGTGKTETLAQATMLLVKKNFEARVLICTHSNSAADLYIIKHFDTFVKKNPDISLLRVYSHERRINTIPMQVKKYCLLSKNKQCIQQPIRENILSHHIIVTTLNTSVSLSRLRDLKGFFSHIFIDEAAQALECEAVMPLSLAIDTTCVVLAGDHMQLSPKIYSEEAKKQKFHRSLLERLFQHYDIYHKGPDGTSPLNILLSINYRTKMEILRFISAISYGSPDRLHEASGLPDVDGIIPLNFYTAYGREVQDPDSTTYYNMAEVEEVVARVQELYENWPAEWGDRHAENIGVVTPYTEQVNRIRAHLRRKKLAGVVVERVMNIQGKELRALFLSTVRTIHLVDKPPEITEAMTESDGDVGDFGFLSDNKLLNTAFTRAQSFIGVVGDPLALCAIGECVFVWRAYLKHCQQLKSIEPQNVTLQSIRTEVESLMKSPKGQNLQMLNHLSEQIRERREAALLAASHPVQTTNAEIPVEGSSDTNKAGTSAAVTEDWSEDFEVKTDDIIKQLAADALKVCQIELEKSKSATTIVNGSDSAEPLISCIRVKEDAGHAVLLYKPSQKDNSKKRQLLGADDHDQEFDSDEDVDQGDSSQEQSAYVDFTHQQLIDMLHKQPETYKHCIIHIENSLRMYATLKEGGSDIQEIKISSRLRCGHAFDGDEVVVELLHVDEEDAQILDDTVVNQGRVVGILRRMINPKYRSFVCMVEEGNAGLMVPLNRGIPKIFNLENKNHLKKTRRGHVCVYRLTRDLDIHFDHYEPVNSSDPMSKLFIVRYLKWDAKFSLPLGIVVGTLPAGTTVERGMKILDIEYSIRKKFRNDTEKEVIRSFSKFTIPSSEIGRRMDFRDYLTFTIDPEFSEDLDDALSIETLPNGQYRIGIHITDVSFFVKRGSATDNEAFLRATSYYPVGSEPVPMLPQQLSTDLCSLKPNQDRLTISVFIIITPNAQIVDTQFRRCIIKSNYRLTYNEVEDLLDGHDIEQAVTHELRLSLLHLHKIAQRWRIQRMGNQGLYMDLDPEASDSPKAHLLVQEFMVQANHHVAMLLMNYCPQCVPLWIQAPPNELALDEWRQKNSAVAKDTVLLTKPFLPRGKVCLCSDKCDCIPTGSDQERSTVDILSDGWEQLKSALVEADEYSAENIIFLAANPENSPSLLLALLQYYRLQKRGAYVCSSDLSEDQQFHYGLNITCYTHFTSPIRRYIDLVVQRLLSSILAKQGPAYSKDDISLLCTHCTDAVQKSRQYERATNILQLSSLIQNSPVTVHSTVEAVDELQIMLRFLRVRGVSPSLGRVAMSLLGLSEKPAVSEDNVVVKWEERVYDVDHDPSAIRKTEEEVVLNPERYIVKIPTDDWRQMLFAVIRGDAQNILLKLLSANEKLIDPSTSNNYARDVSCEECHINQNRFFCRYSLEIRPTSVVRVQLNSDLFRGMLAPRVQLLEVTPTLAICIEHRLDPAYCFAVRTMVQASKPQYRDEESYRTAWLNLLAIESAHCAVTNGDTVIIHNVSILWKTTNDTTTGTLELPLTFCEDRQIEFSLPYVKYYEDEEDHKPDPSLDLDYFCVRYSHTAPPEPVSDQLPEQYDIDFEQPFTWVGHCLSVDSKKNRASGRMIITLRLHQNSVPIPQVLLSDDNKHKATIEFMQKSSTSRYQESAVSDIKDATLLARSIALGQKVPDLDKATLDMMKELKYEEVPGLPEPNSSQQFAISNALMQSFNLIQGPPGTGKTVTGVRIAYLLCQANKRKSASRGIIPQVLYCGPSNKSVDVITEYLKKLGRNCPRIVRVYSTSIVQQQYPPPEDVCCQHRNRKVYVIPEGIRDVTLCHMIRDQSQCSHASTIRHLDDMIRSWRAGDKSVEQVNATEYSEVIRRAEREVLSTCQIVLCTCDTSGSRRVKETTNISQLIIDECGMCTEPESMVPIVSSGAKQVILIGDHKQLQPIVKNKQAKKLGLITSLFERYSSKAYMLNQQYRMHEGIAEFPSEYFYEGRLTCGSDEQSKPSQLKFWPNGRNKPICFVHIMGREETLTVTTDEGNEQSKSNMQEVAQAVRAASLLVRRFHVNPQEVVVLSQYRAQCAEIQRALLHRGEKDINVSTVVAAQGSEWDYVILSNVRSLPKSEIEAHPTSGWCRRKLGFITDHHQINVAIMRARKGLILIGNKYLLACDEMWRKLLTHYEKNHKIVTTSEFMA